MDTNTQETPIASTGFEVCMSVRTPDGKVTTYGSCTWCDDPQYVLRRDIAGNLVIVKLSSREDGFDEMWRKNLPEGTEYARWNAEHDDGPRQHDWRKA